MVDSETIESKISDKKEKFDEKKEEHKEKFGEKKEKGKNIADNVISDLYSSIDEFKEYVEFLKNSSEEAYTLVFVYYYRLRRKHNSTGKFVVNWKYNKDEHFIDLEDQSHCFRDKRLYEMLFDVLQDTSKLGMGTFHTLYTAGELFDIENMEKHVLENIVNSCRAMNYTESNIYRNALEALEQI